MEKKNTILLTVIAIATLLVAVVGATFAYFTAQVTTSNDANNTVKAKTYALTEVTMNYGSKVESEGMYPGSVIAKDFTITAKCPDDNNTCETVYTTLKITVNNPSKVVEEKDENGETITKTINNVFGDHISWKLYKMTNKADTMTCVPGTEKNAGGHYYVDGASCTYGEVQPVASGTATKTYDIPAIGYGTNKTDDKYYLVVEYVNAEGEQNIEQGMEFSVELSYATKTDQTTTTPEVTEPGTDTEAES